MPAHFMPIKGCASGRALLHHTESEGVRQQPAVVSVCLWVQPSNRKGMQGAGSAYL